MFIQMDCRNIYCISKIAKKYTQENAENKELKRFVKYHYILRTEDKGFFKMFIYISVYVT